MRIFMLRTSRAFAPRTNAGSSAWTAPVPTETASTPMSNIGFMPCPFLSRLPELLANHERHRIGGGGVR
jgi:hypothetical protein